MHVVLVYIYKIALSDDSTNNHESAKQYSAFLHTHVVLHKGGLR